MSILSLLEEIKALIADQNKNLRVQALAGKKVLSLDEVVDYFEIPKSTLYNLTSRRLIPHSKKVGLRFNKEEVENWLLSNPIKTDAELDRIASSYILKNRR